MGECRLDYSGSGYVQWQAFSGFVKGGKFLD